MSHNTKQRVYEPSREFLSFDIAGFSHWYGFEVFDRLRPGTKIDLVPEPDNPYDPCAVALYYDDIKIGFVPRDRNGVLSQLLFFGHDDTFTARVAQVREDAHPEHQVRVIVFVKDKRS